MKIEDYQTTYEVQIPNLEGDGIAETVVVRIPVYLDPHTGEEMLTEEAFEIIETTKARHLGLLLPDQIKSLRLRLGLTQKEMSQLLQAGEKSYTRWESGSARPSRMVNVLLRLLDDGEITVETLCGQREADDGWNKFVDWSTAVAGAQEGITFVYGGGPEAAIAFSGELLV